MNSLSKLLWLFLTLGCCLLATPSALAQRTQGHGAELAALGDTRFLMTASSAMLAQNQYTYFKFYSEDYQVTSIELRVEYDDSKLNLNGIDTLHFTWDTAVTFVIASGTGWVDVKIQNIPPRYFNLSQELLKFTWEPECFEDGTNQDLTFNNSGEYINQFVWNGNTYTPTFKDGGQVGIYAYSGDVWGVDDTVPIGHVATVPLRIINNFSPNNGLYAKVIFNSSKLQYQGWDTVGCYDPYCAGGDALTVSANGNVITISSTCQYYKLTSPIDLIHLKFTNNMTVERDSAYVIVDSMKQIDCTDALAVDGSNDTAWVYTPKYEAWIKYKPQNIAKGDESVWIEVQLKQPFEVDMREDDDYAAFRTDVSSWSSGKLTYLAYESYTRGDSTFVWADEEYLGDRIYSSDYAGNTDNIPPSASYGTVLRQLVNAGTTAGYQTVWFDRAGYGQTNFKDDSRLHATGIDLTIISVNNASPHYDSLLYLVKDSIKIFQPGGGGGSCPFVYTWDGSDFVLEDAILTESEKLTEGTAVTDYLPLTFTPAFESGSYRIRIHEEEAEKTFLDEAELMIIDHAPGFDVSVSTEGKVVFGSGRIHPVEVVDEAGKDLTNLLAAEDNQRFEGADNGSVTATFSRREGEIYALSADDSTDWGKDPCEVRSGPLGQTKPEPTTCRIEIQDVLGAWHELPSGSSRLPKSRIRPVIDLSGYDLPALFKVRYTWEGDFSLDEVTLSVQVPVEHVLQKASATGITHSSDHPSAMLAAQEDGRFAELVTGEYLDLEFPAERVPDGMERSLVLMTKGYFLQWFGHEDAARPLAFGLNGNYPNPFNPSTTIRYSLAAEALVKLEIFNVLGQRVRTLVADATQPAGSYDAFWDGTSDNGQFVGSGVYLYRLQAADFVETRKMIMLK
jgi:hypothetical protein